jgi:Ca-activated chloride channel family protein
VKTEIKFDYAKVPVKQSIEIRLLGKLLIDDVTTKLEKRNKLNVALVLDRSGSMSGNKLERVKDAAVSFIKKMKDDDIVSLTSFDDHVIVELLPAVAIEQRTSGVKKIISIRSGGSTFLSGGYEKGFELAKENHKSEMISRIILLTDGQANVGIIDGGKLSSIAKQFAEKGISTTTIGVGEDFVEQLLGSMADSGLGHTYYIETPQDAESVFEEEIGYLLSIGARNIVYTFKASISGISIGQFNNFVEEKSGSYVIGDLYGGKERSILLEIGIPAIQNIGKHKIGDIQIDYELLDGEQTTKKSITFPVEIEVVEASVASGINPDKEVVENLCIFLIANAKKEMLLLMERREFEQVQKVIEVVIEKVKAFGISSELLETELSELKLKADLVGEYGNEYYMADKKRLFYESNNAMKGEVYASKALHSRRENSDHDPLEKLKKFFKK